MGGELKKTPLHGEHVRLHAKLVDFNHWEMPLQYSTGILKEHEAVRTGAGLFDVSHMGRFEIGGPGAVAFTNHLITNDLERSEVGQLLYTPVCDESGGVLDDVTVYRLADRVLMVVNAGNLGRIWDWLGRQAPAWKGPEVRLKDRSGELAQLAFQGPATEQIFAPMVEGDLAGLGYYRSLTARVNGIDGVLVSRNGYTGEDGFEIYAPAERAAELWRALLEAGKAWGTTAIGLGARDTLRLEMCYCLYGNELNPEINPLEAGLQWTVKLKKPGFVGKEALVRQKEQGLRRTLVGFEVEGSRLARGGQKIWKDGREIGAVTSGGFCPSLKRGMGLGYVPPELAAAGTGLEVDVRGEKVAARVVQRPFYKEASHR
jgi:aminomethyltransferase